MNIYFLLPLITSILYLQAGVFVFAMDRRSKPNLVFFFLSLAFAVYAFGSAFYIASDSLQQAAFWYRFATPGMRLYPFLTLAFILALGSDTASPFIKFLSRPLVLVFLLIPPAILIAATFTTPDYFSGFRKLDTGWLNESFPSSKLSLLYLCYMLGYFILSNVVLIIQRRMANSIRIIRQSATIQLFSIIMFGLALFVSTALPRLVPGDGMPRLISSVPVIWLAGIVYTIFKHKLFLYRTNYGRMILENIEGLFLVTDTDLRITSCTPAAAEFLQTEASLLEGSKLGEVFSLSDGDSDLFARLPDGGMSGVTLRPFYKTDHVVMNLTVIHEKSGLPGACLVYLQPKGASESLLKSRGLTAREIDVINLLLKGKSNPQIAEELFISLATVKTHLLKAFRKLGVDNRYEIFSLISSSSRQNHTIG